MLTSIDVSDNALSTNFASVSMKGLRMNKTLKTVAARSIGILNASELWQHLTNLRECGLRHLDISQVSRSDKFGLVQ